MPDVAQRATSDGMHIRQRLPKPRSQLTLRRAIPLPAAAPRKARIRDPRKHPPTEVVPDRAQAESARGSLAVYGGAEHPGPTDDESANARRRPQPLAAPRRGSPDTIKPVTRPFSESSASTKVPVCAVTPGVTAAA